nr:hypothetical protein [Tanacetum cinerariifolium]
MQKSSSSTPYVPPSRNDWDFLFQLMFDELLNPPSSVVPQAPEVITLIAEVISPVQAKSTGSPSSTTVDQDAPSPSKSQTTPETQSAIIPQDVKEDNINIEVAHMGNDSLFGVPIPEVNSAQSSSMEALTQSCWIEAMQEELNEFERLENCKNLGRHYHTIHQKENRILEGITKMVIPSGFQELEVRKGHEAYGVNLQLRTRRPRKNRVKAQSEKNSQVSRVGRSMTCSNYQQSGHTKTRYDKDQIPKPPRVNRAPVPKPSEYRTYASARGGGRGSKDVRGGIGECSGGRGEGSGGRVEKSGMGQTNGGIGQTSGGMGQTSG